MNTLLCLCLGLCVALTDVLAFVLLVFWVDALVNDGNLRREVVVWSTDTLGGCWEIVLFQLGQLPQDQFTL